MSENFFPDQHSAGHKWTIHIACSIFLQLLLAGSLFGYELQIVNSSDESLDRHPVTVNMSELPVPLRTNRLTVRARDGRAIKSQVDDLDRDGSPDELVLLMNFAPHERKVLVVQRGPDSEAADGGEEKQADVVLENEHLLWSWEGKNSRIFKKPENTLLLKRFHVMWNGSGGDHFSPEGAPRMIADGPLRSIAQKQLVLYDRDQNDTGVRAIKRHILYRGQKRVHWNLALRNTTNSDVRMPTGLDVNFFSGDPLTPEGIEPGDLLTPPRTQIGSYLLSNRGHQLWIHPDNKFGLGAIQHRVNGWRKIKRSKGAGFRQLRLRHFHKHPPDLSFKGNLAMKNMQPGDYITLPARSTRSFPVTFGFYRGNEQEISKRYRRDVLTAPGAVHVIGHGNRILKQAESPVYLRETFDDAQRWFTEGNTKLHVNNGAAMVTGTAGATIFTPVVRDFRDPTILSGSCPDRSSDTSVHVILQDRRSGEQHDLGPVSGDFSFNLSEKLPYNDRRKFLLKITLKSTNDGENKETLRARMDHIHLRWPYPEPPELDTPYDGQTVRPAGVTFSIFPRSPSRTERSYEIQVAKDDSFSDVHRTYEGLTRFTGKAEIETLLPEQRFRKGTYYWRARSVGIIGNPGPWSDVRQFDVTPPEQRTKPPIREISPEHPLFILPTRKKGRAAMVWNKFPPSVRKHVVFQIGLKHHRGQNFDKWLSDRTAYIGDAAPAETPFPILLRFHKVAELSLLDHLFENYPRVLGFYFGEKGYESRSLKRGLKLAAGYGRYAGNLGDAYPLLDPGGKENTAVLQDLGSYFLPVVKQNNKNSPLISVFSAMGLYLCGRTNAWGAETEWGNAFKALDWTRSHKSDITTLPPDYMSTFVVGLAGGATVWRFENFFSNHPNYSWHKNLETSGGLWHRAMKPFFVDVVKHDLIPSRKAVRNRAAVSFEMDPSYLRHDPSNPYTEFPNRNVGAAYGFNDEATARHKLFEYQWIPDSSQYFPVTLMPLYLSKQERSAVQTIVDPGRFGSPKDVRQYISSKYPQPTGPAFAIRVGDTGVVTNSIDLRKNATPQSFELPLTKGPVQTIKGKVGFRQYLILKQKENELFLHANNYKLSYSTIRLEASNRPEVNVKPRDALTDVQWNTEENELLLRLNHNSGVARAFVRAP